jgi:hypothetical protein
MAKAKHLSVFAGVLILAGASNAQAASILMSMTTESTGVTSTAEAEVYYENYGYGEGIWHIGYPEDDPRYDPNKPGYDWETAEGTVHLEGWLDPDPQMFLVGAVTDLGAPSNFSFVFTMALTPNVENPSTVQDGFSGSLANSNANNAISVTALPPPAGIPADADGVTEIQVYTLSNNGGTSWQNVGLDQGPSVSLTPGPLTATVYGPYNEGPIPTIASANPWTHMRADVNFRLSGGGDSFAFTGVKFLVPEPGTFVLAMLSFGAICGCRRQVC